MDHNNEYAGYFSSDYASNNTQVVHAVYDGDSYYDAVAVYGESTPLDNYNYGIGGEFIGSFYGVNASSDAGSAGGTAYGVRSICKGTSGTRYGLFSHAESGTIRYGIYAQAAAQTDSYGIYCSGNGVYTGTWTNTSDQMLKKNITEIQDALSIIMQLQPKSYEYKRDEFDFINLAEGKHHGFIAQHLEEVLPELVGTATQPMSDDKNPQMFEFKTANTIELIPILTQAIREQQKLIEELQQQVAQLLQEKE